MKKIEGEEFDLEMRYILNLRILNIFLIQLIFYLYFKLKTKDNEADIELKEMKVV